MSAGLHTLARAAVTDGRKLLAPYLCAGFPSAEMTLPLLHAIADAGADWIELGVPFSDPLADGGSIQAAAQQALSGGMTLGGALEIAARFASQSRVPLVLMSYVNPLLRAGGGVALRRAAEAGCSACIVPDLPPEEAHRLSDAGGSTALPLVPLVAPNTPDARLRAVATPEPPFLYCVSVLGVTGVRANVSDTIAAFLARVRAQAPGVPAMIGFGVAGPEQAASLAAWSDGVIVGSAIVDRLRSPGGTADPVATAERFIGELRAALDRGAPARPAAEQTGGSRPC